MLRRIFEIENLVFKYYVWIVFQLFINFLKTWDYNPNYERFGKVDDVEIDFVAQNYEGNLYIQVSATVRDKSTLERELKPLQIVKDNYPKLLLTLDDDSTVDFDGIKQINVLEWLLI